MFICHIDLKLSAPQGILYINHSRWGKKRLKIKNRRRFHNFN